MYTRPVYNEQLQEIIVWDDQDFIREAISSMNKQIVQELKRQTIFAWSSFNTHARTHMGQGFSLTSNSTRVAQLERDLVSEKGKCSKNDVVITDLQREVQILKKQNEELEEATETNKQLELENQDLEKQLETLANASNTNRTNVEACSTRAQELKNKNIALRRKLETLNEKPVVQRDVASPTVAALQGRVRSLETELIKKRNELIRITRFSAQNFTAATYKRTWVIRNPKWNTSSITGELRLMQPNMGQMSYNATFSIRDNVMTIAALPEGKRRVPEAGPIWNELLEMVGKNAPRAVVTKPVQSKVGEPKPSTVSVLPSFLRQFPRPWRAKTNAEKPTPVVVARPYRRDANIPTSKIAASYTR